MVKLYVRETGSREVQQWTRDAQVIATSRITYVEMRAALARKWRDKTLVPKAYRVILHHVDEDWESTSVVEITGNLSKQASFLAEKHALRGLDAIQLASAVVLRKEGNRDISFACFDVHLAAAARKEGLVVS